MASDPIRFEIIHRGAQAVLPDGYALIRRRRLHAKFQAEFL
jgi:hypothetical protein